MLKMVNKILLGLFVDTAEDYKKSSALWAIYIGIMALWDTFSQGKIQNVIDLSLK